MKGGRECGILLSKGGMAVVLGQAIAEPPVGIWRKMNALEEEHSKRGVGSWKQPVKAGVDNFPGMSSVPVQLLMCLSILLKTRYCGINCVLAFPRDVIRKSKTPILVGPTPSCLWDTNPRRSICTGRNAGRGNGRESDRHVDRVKEGRSQGKQGKERKWDVSHAISSVNTLQSICSPHRFLGISRSPQCFFRLSHPQPQRQLPLKGIHLLLKYCSYRKKPLEAKYHGVAQPPKRAFVQSNWANRGCEPQKKQCILTKNIGWLMLRYWWVIIMILQVIIICSVLHTSICGFYHWIKLFSCL